ncbi:MAG: type VI secretion system tube protein Hcp [Hydrogenophilaceae bacterium]
MAVDMFIELGAKIKGETQDKDFKGKGACDVLAWSWGMSQSGTTHMGPGGGAGKANFQDVSFTKWLDKATPALMIALAKGSHIDECKLTCRKAGEGQQKYLEITMKEVIVSSVSTGGSGGEDRLTENVTLNFADVKLEYFVQDAKGVTASAGVFAWNIAENAAKG